MTELNLSLSLTYPSGETFLEMKGVVNLSEPEEPTVPPEEPEEPTTPPEEPEEPTEEPEGVVVTSLSELRNALKSGGLILLSEGNYGDWTETGTVCPPGTTIRSFIPHAARFNKIEFEGGCSNLTVENIRASVIDIFDSKDITFRQHQVQGNPNSRSSLRYAIRIVRGTNVLIEDGTMSDCKNGLYAVGYNGLTVRGNFVDRWEGSDAFKFSGGRNLLVEYNFGGESFHTDGAHMDFIQVQGALTDAVFRRNIYLGGNNLAVQGIFLDDAQMTNILVEENIIATGMLRGISINSGAINAVARNNTVIWVPGGPTHNSSQVIGPWTSENNIYTHNSNPGKTGSNVKITTADPNSPYFVDKFYKNASKGRHMTIEDLVPVVGSEAETKGASSFIRDLLLPEEN